jgi:Rrf2 family protein
VRISAKVDYAVRAAIELAAAPDEKPICAERLATAQGIPVNFLENILGELRHAGIVRSHRGFDGGFRLARAADQVTIADIIRAVEGPLATVRGGPTPPTLGRQPRCRGSGSLCERTCAASSST